MKKKKFVKMICILVAVLLISPVMAIRFDAVSSEDKQQQYCKHAFYFEFNDETMTLIDVYEGATVESLLLDASAYGAQHNITVTYNGIEVTEGPIAEGMVVYVYHNNDLYGTYTVAPLRPSNFDADGLPKAETEATINTTINATSVAATGTSTNQYGFILPLDNMNLTSNISQQFQPNNVHRGIDIYWNNIQGTPVRAAKAGTVVAAENHSSWGYYVKIDHGDGMTTLYAHMSNNLQVSKNQSVAIGQIIGYVGNTGNVTNYHLHLELTVNSVLKDPIPYLAGAPTYNGSSHYHSFSYTYEAAHPHRQYRVCSSCGYTEYTGNVRNEYVEENHEAAHPHRVYRVCACGVTEYTGATVPNYISTYYEAAHPHRVYRTCSCGAVDYTGDNHLDYISTYYEAAHPHRVYRTCSCGAVDYTGDNHLDYISTYYEGAHPHRIYRTCSCGAVDYTGGYKYIESCAQCNP